MWKALLMKRSRRSPLVTSGKTDAQEWEFTYRYYQDLADHAQACWRRHSLAYWFDTKGNALYRP